MVACAAGASVAAIQLLVGQPIIGSSGSWMQQNSSCAIIDQLKQRLLLVIENTDESGAAEVISKLEGLTLTKDVLEFTRIGLTVNEIRRRTATSWPNLSKRCRSLIKSWQKMADLQRPLSSCEGSSNGCTPNLVSPNIRRGLTPGGGKRVTSAESKCLTSKISISPNTGSYAPRKSVISPYNISVHKSASVGDALCSINFDSRRINSKSSPEMPAGEDAASFNAAEKRKAEAAVSTTSVKRSKTIGNNLCQVTSPSRNNGLLSATSAIKTSNSSSSVNAARKDVQSTAELVAQLTENLPQNMTIDLNKLDTEPRKSLVCESKNSVVAVNLSAGSYSKNSSPQCSSASMSNSLTLNKTKRKYTKRAAKFFRNSFENSGEKNFNLEPNSNLDSIQEEHLSPAKREYSVNGFDDCADSFGKRMDNEADSNSSSYLSSCRSSNFWIKTIPTIESLSTQLPEYAEPNNNATKSIILPIRQRHVLLLPYCDIGAPDFLEYDYPDREKFYAGPENYRQ